eukprot:CAMPEP_0116036474 /NCGR_PEP_ID=MMETSP0321-20121206/21238_1 /TAXON_ID=163516 /ORGANISM="Leptocylindrus danicus var. danicus, Strain B650" /LENGTH=82 /DNA_ID=CAMNT_0003514011 /DNA_START=36 /DNA_END=280 /DNA_ORIENTATION=-
MEARPEIEEDVASADNGRNDDDYSSSADVAYPASTANNVLCPTPNHRNTCKRKLSEKNDVDVALKTGKHEHGDEERNDRITG